MHNMIRSLLILSLAVVGFSQVFTEDFEDGDISEWHQYRADEEMIQVIDMSAAPAVLLDGGDKVGFIHDVDASYSGAAILLTGNPTDVNYTVEANVYVYENHANGSAYTGIVAYADSSTGYYVKLAADFDGDNRFRLYNNQLAGFSYTWHHAIDASNVDKTQGWHYMKIEVSTNWADSSVSYHCWYDETDLGTYVDDSNGHNYQGMPGLFAFQMDGDGLEGYFDNYVVTPAGGTSVDSKQALPVKMSLAQNYPNPFNPSTTLAFEITTSGHTNLSIYNLKGELVKTLAQGEIQPGRYEVIWNASDAAGQPVPTGNYIAVLTQGSEQLSRGMLLIK